MKRLLIALVCGLCAVSLAVDLAAVSASPSHAVTAKKKCKKKKRAASAKKKKKCKQKKPSVPTTPGTGGSTAPPPPPPPPPPDPCPGFTVCPATIYQINQGVFPNGTDVRITNALVTATMPDDSAFWVQVKNAAATDFAGLEVASGAQPPPSPGLTVTIEGIVGAQSLTATQIQNSGAPTEPAGLRDVTAEFFSDDDNAPKLNGNFVRVPSPGTLSSHVGGNWLMSTGFTVGNRIIGTLPPCVDGASFSQIVGIADIESGDLVLLPPSPGAIAPSSPCA